jgi:hypothetical protein
MGEERNVCDESLGGKVMHDAGSGAGWETARGEVVLCSRFPFGRRAELGCWERARGVGGAAARETGRGMAVWMYGRG